MEALTAFNERYRSKSGAIAARAQRFFSLDLCVHRAGHSGLHLRLLLSKALATKTLKSVQTQIKLQLVRVVSLVRR
jgi:hypothetical protein